MATFDLKSTDAVSIHPSLYITKSLWFSFCVCFFVIRETESPAPKEFFKRYTPQKMWKALAEANEKMLACVDELETFGKDNQKILDFLSERNFMEIPLSEDLNEISYDANGGL